MDGGGVCVCVCEKGLPPSLFCTDRHKIGIQNASDRNKEYMFNNIYCLLVYSMKKNQNIGLWFFMFKDMSSKTNNSMPYIKDSFLQMYY